MRFHLLLLNDPTEQARVSKSEALLGGEDLVESLYVQHRVEPFLGLQLGQAVEKVENRFLSYPMNLLLRRQQFVVWNVGKDIALAESKY